ncbi:hypothetical protein D9611_010128 [Ephemerocybe angulata]|uniref:Uncharacterized protein n=1 Tax=Ephemerocybe angulata TaxID=980116 RepID=A0A8H5EV95_9AGAR|nr:hypothetical protein D9611_010128 [Tulosesus angulatus]
MVFITKNVAVAALLIAPAIAAPLSQTLDDFERRATGSTVDRRELAGELEERGGLALGAIIGGLFGWNLHKKKEQKKKEEEQKKKEEEERAGAQQARDLVDEIYAREVLNRAGESRELAGGLEERAPLGMGFGVGALLGWLGGKKAEKKKAEQEHAEQGKREEEDANHARDLVDFIYAREVLKRARALERRNALQDMIDELD